MLNLSVEVILGACEEFTSAVRSCPHYSIPSQALFPWASQA